MKTTLKRGIGRSSGADQNGNGERERPRRRRVRAAGARAPLPRRAAAPPRRSGASSSSRSAGSSPSRSSSAAGLAGGAYLYLEEGVGAQLAPRDEQVRVAAEKLDAVPAGEPAIALAIGYDKRLGAEAEVNGARSDTIMLMRADPQTDSVSMLSFPRDLVVPIHCPGKAAVREPDQRGVLHLRRPGDGRDRPPAHRAADQLPDHGQLPRVQAARRQPRRRLDGRRPALLQPRGDGLRVDRHRAGLPEAERAGLARLRALPPHRLRPLPARPAAALRPGVQAGDDEPVLAHRPAGHRQV